MVQRKRGKRRGLRLWAVSRGLGERGREGLRTVRWIELQFPETLNQPYSFPLRPVKSRPRTEAGPSLHRSPFPLPPTPSPHLGYGAQKAREGKRAGCAGEVSWGSACRRNG